jgi:hypothetical protein
LPITPNANPPLSPYESPILCSPPPVGGGSGGGTFPLTSILSHGGERKIKVSGIRRGTKGGFSQHFDLRQKLRQEHLPIEKDRFKF